VSVLKFTLSNSAGTKPGVPPLALLNQLAAVPQLLSLLPPQ
jgi:hypothetical protein